MFSAKSSDMVVVLCAGCQGEGKKRTNATGKDNGLEMSSLSTVLFSITPPECLPQLCPVPA